MIISIPSIVLISISVIPVRIAAGLLGAQTKGYVACFIAVAATLFASQFAADTVESTFINFVLMLLVTGVLFSVILSASYLKSVVLALLSYSVQVLVGLILVALGLSTALITL